MEPYEVLMSVARDLQAEAVRYVPLVVTHGPAAVPEPFGSLIAVQHVTAPELFHLPEPLLHPIARPDVLAVGLNPGFNAAESMPTLASSLEDYVAWYATRFDTLGRTRTGWPASTRDDNPDKGGRSHYAEVERVLVAAGLGLQPLGRRASYADAIPWKGNPAPSLDDPRIAEMARARIRQIVEGLQPSVILALSPAIGALFGAAHPRQVEARAAALGDWQGQIVAMYHPNHRFRGAGSRIAHRSAVAAALASAVQIA
jgi:hypothetical protein